MATQKPDYMTQQAWDYLLQFTVAHEAMVLHMYNNRASEAAKQDVTCGIGFLLINRDTATGPDYKLMFYDPATNRPPTAEQLRADWDEAAKLLRRHAYAPGSGHRQNVIDIKGETQVGARELAATGDLYFHAIAGAGRLRELFLRLVSGESSQLEEGIA